MSDFSMVEVELKGAAPLIMHNVRLADPLDEVSQQVKAITAKRTKKTETDIEQLIWLEFLGGLYWDKESGVYIPAEWIEGTIRDAARTNNKGKDVTAGLMVDEPKCKLLHDGPDDPKKLFKTDGSRDYRSVVVQRKRIMRLRPRFNEWSVKATLVVINEVLSVKDVGEWLVKAGKIKGLGDYRPRFGRFTVERFDAA